MAKRNGLIKSCPKCGTERLFMGVYTHFPHLKEIDCCACGYSGGKALTRNGAVRKWNKKWKKVHEDV